MMKMRWILLACLVIIYGVLPAVVLTLEDCRDLAGRNNKELQQAWEEVEKYRQDYRNVRGNLLPQLSLSAGYQYTKTEMPDSAVPESFSLVDELDDFASANDTLLAEFMEQVSTDFIPKKVTGENSAFGQLRLDQVIFMGGKLINGINVAGKLYRLQEKKYFLTRQEIIFTATDKYLRTKLLERVVEIQQDALDYAARYYNQVNDMYQEGLVSEYDQLRARLEYLRLQPEMLEARKNYDLALTDLRNFLGLTADPQLADSITMIPMEEINLTQAMAEGLANRLEIDLSELNVAVRRVNLRYEKGNFLPNIGIFAEYNYFGQSENRIADDDWGNYYTLGIGFNMPIFTGFSNTAKAVKARHELKQAEVQHQHLLEMIELEIRNIWLQWQADLEKVNTQQENVALAEKGLTIAEARYENQVSNQLEVIDAQLQLKSTRLGYLNAIYAALISYQRLQKAMGREL
ncbi:MAG: TolC family protein [Candidatus Cloacimonetes bacterium]|nr:TolC family protein [Candidatus Cloacimonadota bacterium]